MALCCLACQLARVTSTLNTIASHETTPGEETGSTACPVAQADNPIYLQTPPPYPPICGSNARSSGHTHNLFTHWLEMTDADATGNSTTGEGFGKVLGSVEDLQAYFAQAMESMV